MLNVHIVTDNEYLQVALQSIIRSIKEDAKFNFNNNKEIPESYYRADIVIIHLKPGDIYTCNLRLKYWKENRKLIFIVEKQKVPESRLSPCLKDAYFLTEDEEICRYYAVLEGILCETQGGGKLTNADCSLCSYKYLTPYQLLILNAIKFDYSIPEISRALDIKPTTIYTQINRVKKNFGIIRNIDLFHFIKNVNLSCNSRLLKMHNIFIVAFNITFYL